MDPPNHWTQPRLYTLPTNPGSKLMLFRWVIAQRCPFDLPSTHGIYVIKFTSWVYIWKTLSECDLVGKRQDLILWQDHTQLFSYSAAEGPQPTQTPWPPDTSGSVFCQPCHLTPRSYRSYTNAGIVKLFATSCKTGEKLSEQIFMEASFLTGKISSRNIIIIKWKNSGSASTTWFKSERPIEKAAG